MHLYSNINIECSSVAASRHYSLARMQLSDEQRDRNDGITVNLKRCLSGLKSAQIRGLLANVAWTS